jgi:hypothetical protein
MAAERADRVVEVAAVLDAEALGHRDLDALEVVAVPERLEHRVREPEVEQLLEPHLPEEVVDPVELRLRHVLVQLRCERPRRHQVVAERLLDDDAGGLGQAGRGEPFYHRAEQEGRDLQIEDGELGAFHDVADPVVGGRVVERSLHVREPCRQAVEHLRVELLARPHDRLARALAELVDGPVVNRDADDRGVEQPSLLQPVERPERHHLRQVARDSEDDKDVGGLSCRRGRRLRLASCRHGGHRVLLMSFRWEP